MVHKFDMPVIEGVGGRDKKVSVKGALVNKHGLMKNREGMDTLSMVVSIVWRT